MIYELFGDMTDLMEIMILWLEQQGIVPTIRGQRYRRYNMDLEHKSWHTFIFYCGGTNIEDSVLKEVKNGD